MKRIWIFLIEILFFLLIIISSLAIKINEVMYNPPGEDNNKEWIEIYSDDEEVDLTNWTIGDNSSNDTLVLLKYENSNYILIVEEGFDFYPINAKIYSVGAAIGNGLGNSGDTIYLYDPNGTLVDFVSYNNSFANGNNKSLELFNNSFYESLYEGGTPGAENSISLYFKNLGDFTNQTNTTEESIQKTENCDASISIETEKEIYENGESIKFKHRIMNSSSNFKIEYWIEDLFGNIVKAKRITQNLNQKSYSPKITEEEKAFIIKSILYSDCDSDESNNYAEKIVIVKNKNIKEDSEQLNERFEYDLLSYPQKVISGKEFSVLIRIKSDDSPHLISISSYVYLNSKRYSNETHEEIMIEKNEEKIVELKNVVNAMAGEYKLKVKLRKDSSKTEYEITKNITVEKKDFVLNDSKEDINMSLNVSNNTIMQNITPTNNWSRDINETRINDEVPVMIYKSKSKRALELIPYVIISIFTILSAVLIWRR